MTKKDKRNIIDTKRVIDANKNGATDKDVLKFIDSATIYPKVSYTNNKVGCLNKKLVDSIIHMIDFSFVLGSDTKTILRGLGVDASIKQFKTNGMIVTELYLRDKNVNGSKKVKVRTTYDVDYDEMGKELLSSKSSDTEFITKNAKGVVEYCNSKMGQWSDVRGAYDEMNIKDMEDIDLK